MCPGSLRIHFKTLTLLFLINYLYCMQGISTDMHVVLYAAMLVTQKCIADQYKKIKILLNTILQSNVIILNKKVKLHPCIQETLSSRVSLTYLDRVCARAKASCIPYNNYILNLILTINLT